MKLIKLELNNYCQYDKLTVLFDDGVTILRGKNGRGKSNLINAIFFALTGDSCIKNKTRTGMLKWGTDKGYVELTFDVHGTIYIVKRMLHSSSVSLKGDTVDIGKSKEASDFVAELINADSDVLKLSSFMPQAGANELVFGTKTERQKAFSRLFRYLHLENVRVDLQKEYNKIPVYPDTTDIITRLAGEIAVLEEGLKALEEQSFRKYLDSNTDKYNKMYAAKDKQYTETEFNEVKAKHVSKSVIDAALKKQLEEGLKELGDPVIITTEESEKYRKFKEFERVCTDMLTAKEKVDNPLRIEDEITEDLYSTHSEDCESQRVRTIELEKKLALWRSGKCGECGTDFKHTPEEIEELSKEATTAASIASDMYEDRANMEKTLDAQKEVARKNAEDKKVFETLQVKVLELSEQFKDYDPQVYLDKQKEAEKSQDLIKQKDEINRLLKEKEADIALTERNIATMDATGFKPDDFSQEFLEEYAAKYNKEQEAGQQKASISTALTLKKSQMGERKTEQKLSVLADKHRKFIAGLRNVLHVDNYPRLAVSMKKEKLSIIINKYLDIFEQPFTITINDSLEFICVFSDNPNVSADELSGGQKAMLLVSTRLAIAEMLASSVELLTFDEPGAAMDKDAKAGLLEAFDTVRKYLSGQRIQILVASHDSNIEGIADGVINL